MSHLIINSKVAIDFNIFICNAIVLGINIDIVQALLPFPLSLYESQILWHL